MMRRLHITRSINLLAALVAASGAVAAAVQADPGTLSQLTPVGGGSGGGMVEVSPTAHDVVGPDTFNVEGTVNVHGLAPETGYRFLRWFDFNPDGSTRNQIRSLRADYDRDHKKAFFAGDVRIAMTGEVEIRAEKDALVIRSAKKPRQGWATAFRDMCE